MGGLTYDMFGQITGMWNILWKYRNLIEDISDEHYIYLFLLSLILLSCIVAPKRDLGNIFSFTSATSSTTKHITFLPAFGAIDINNYNVDNYDGIRGRTISFSKANLRTTLMSSSISSKLYHNKMEQFNDLFDEEFRELVDSFQLSYNDNRGKINQISKITNHEDSTR